MAFRCEALEMFCGLEKLEPDGYIGWTIFVYHRYIGVGVYVV